MQKLSLIVALGLSLAVSELQADTGGMAKDQEEATAMIISPTDGATLTAFKPVKVSYKAIFGPKGDHLHLYVDGFRVAELNQPAGDHEIKMLHPGMHKLRLEIVNKDHQYIRVGKEISVDVIY